MEREREGGRDIEGGREEGREGERDQGREVNWKWRGPTSGSAQTNPQHNPIICCMVCPPAVVSVTPIHTQFPLPSPHTGETFLSLTSHA